MQAPDANALTCAYLDGTLPANPSYMPAGLNHEDIARMRTTPEPSSIFLEKFFLDGVLLQPLVAGIVRSLLGRGVGLPVVVSHHGGTPELDVVGPAQPWHHVRPHPRRSFLSARHLCASRTKASCGAPS